MYKPSWWTLLTSFVPGGAQELHYYWDAPREELGGLASSCQPILSSPYKDRKYRFIIVTNNEAVAGMKIEFSPLCVCYIYI